MIYRNCHRGSTPWLANGVPHFPADKNSAPHWRGPWCDPKLLILDDSLASIDVKTSAEIIYELRKAKAQCTSIIVSQRMTALQHADEIIVLDQGEIAERGTHEQLMALNGSYAAMVHREHEQAQEH